eukprot:1509077-Rhodomonas_salina.2
MAGRGQEAAGGGDLCGRVLLDRRCLCGARLAAPSHVRARPCVCGTGAAKRGGGTSMLVTSASAWHDHTRSVSANDGREQATARTAAARGFEEEEREGGEEKEEEDPERVDRVLLLLHGRRPPAQSQQLRGNLRQQRGVYLRRGAAHWLRRPPCPHPTQRCERCGGEGRMRDEERGGARRREEERGGARRREEERGGGPGR